MLLYRTVEQQNTGEWVGMRPGSALAEGPGAGEARTVRGSGLVWSLAHALNDGYPSLYLALLPVLMARWHFTAGQAGLLAGVLALSTQGLQPFLGWWADRHGGPWFIVGGILVGSLGASVGLAWAPSYAVFAVALLLAGVGNAAFHPHMAALVTQATPDAPGRRMSGWMVSGMIGHALAPLAVVIAWHWAHSLGLALLALPGLLVALPLYASARHLPMPTWRAAPSWSALWRAARRRARPFFLVVVLRNLGTASLLTLLPILWHVRGGLLSESGMLLTVAYGTGMAGNLVGGRLSDRTGPRLVLVGSLGLAAVAAAAWVLGVGTGWGFWGLVGLWGFAANGAGATVLVYGQSLFPEQRAMASGLTMGIGNTVGAFGAWGIGAIAVSFGMTAGILVAALCLLAAVAPSRLLAADDGRMSQASATAPPR